MLVVVSDLHLTDGSAGTMVPSGAFRIFEERLRALAEGASWRSDGSFRPIECIDLILLGDIFDLIRSSRWLQGTVRPWDDVNSPEMKATLTSILTDIMEQNEHSLRMLRSLSAENAVYVPFGSGRSSTVQSIPVRLHYMVGNHDWMLHLPGADYNTMRRMVVERMGLANRSDVPFPHDPSENEELLTIMRNHRVFARHGDIFDPINYEQDRDSSSLGDAIVIELVGRFSVEVAHQLAHDLPQSVLAGLREIDNIRPLLMIPVWIDGLLERSCPYPAIRKKVKQIWDRLVDDFLQLPFIRQRDTWCPFDLVDGLEGTLKFSKSLSIGWVSKIAQWMASMRGTSSNSYYQHALTEQDFRNRRARHIVYGHTHNMECVPLDASYADDFVLNQMYFNSGTWRRVHRPTQLAPDQHEFIPTECMSYLAFFQGNERGGRAYESWSGMLGVSSCESTSYRIDPGRSRHGPTQQFQTSDLQSRSPHFSPSSAAAFDSARDRV